MGDLIDFTKFRKGSKPYGRPIRVCPKCGKKGEYSQHRIKQKDGTYRRLDDSYTHTAEDIGFAHMVKEQCTIRPEEAD